MKFDELNKLLTKYYDIMDISKEDKRKRVVLGLDLYDAFIYILLSIKAEAELGRTPDMEGYVSSLDYRIRDILIEHDLPFDEEYIPKLSQDIVETTLRHLDEDYYFSEDRAVLITQNEANTIMNSVDFTNAKQQGYKYKEWITEGDSKVRDTHVAVDMMKIPIDDLFPVGTDNMRYPHDYVNGSAENLINCRCSCHYS